MSADTPEASDVFDVFERLVEALPEGQFVVSFQVNPAVVEAMKDLDHLMRDVRMGQNKPSQFKYPDERTISVDLSPASESISTLVKASIARWRDTIPGDHPVNNGFLRLIQVPWI